VNHIVRHEVPLLLAEPVAESSHQLARAHEGDKPIEEQIENRSISVPKAAAAVGQFQLWRTSRRRMVGDMPARASKSGPFWVLAAALLVALTFIFEHVYGELVSQVVLTYAANRFGITGEHLVASLAPLVVFGSLAAFLLFVAYRLAYWHLAQTVFAEDPHNDALALTSMNVNEIAVYLRDKSVWAWRTYARLNGFVQDHVATEMTRAGRDGKVRFIGTGPIGTIAEEIDSTYWRFYQIDSDRIWDERNETFTVERGLGHGAPGLSSRRFGKAPRMDVMRTWPRASFVRKHWALAWVEIKKVYWSIKYRFID